MDAGSGQPTDSDALLEDGTYDALVVDATLVVGSTAVSVDLTILAGGHKGEVVAVRVEGLGHDPLELLGIPATLVVSGGQPSVTFEP